MIESIYLAALLASVSAGELPSVTLMRPVFGSSHPIAAEVRRVVACENGIEYRVHRAEARAYSENRKHWYQ